MAEIQPIFNKRCVACHGCLGSPCNLKLTSFRAAERGALVQNPYSIHLEDYQRTGMDVVQTTAEWRKHGFYPVLSRGGSKLEYFNLSLLYRMVEAGTRHNKPGFSRQTLIPIYSRRYKHQCPATPDAVKAHLRAPRKITHTPIYASLMPDRLIRAGHDGADWVFRFRQAA
ncbi:MAG: hypothetical protein GY877_06950 [Hyphomicrobium sp.]|nr:hypothetical protein [Hyphomicrobium sp.]